MQKFYSYNEPLFPQRNVRTYNKKAMNNDMYKYKIYDILLQSALHLHTVRLFTEGDDTRGCGNTICPPEDEEGAARNMLRIVM